MGRAKASSAGEGRGSGGGGGGTGVGGVLCWLCAGHLLSQPKLQARGSLLPLGLLSAPSLASRALGRTAGATKPSRDTTGPLLPRALRSTPLSPALRGTLQGQQGWVHVSEPQALHGHTGRHSPAQARLPQPRRLRPGCRPARPSPRSCSQRQPPWPRARRLP